MTEDELDKALDINLAVAFKYFDKMSEENCVKPDVDIENILNDFTKNLLENQQELGPEFQKVLDDNFWDLVSDE